MRLRRSVDERLPSFGKWGQGRSVSRAAKWGTGSRRSVLLWVFFAAILTSCSNAASETRASGTCPPVTASTALLGQTIGGGLTGNFQPVKTTLHVGDYLWVILSRPPSAVYYPEASYPDSVPPGNHPGVLDRLCTQGSATTTKGLFVAKGVGLVQVLFEPRPSRAPMIGFEADVTVLPAVPSRRPST